VFEKEGCKVTYEEGLKESMKDELEDARKYRQLSTLAPNESIKERILCIVDDELAHARFFAELLSMQLDMTVMSLGYLLNTRDFMEGLRQAIEGELGGLRRYSELASGAPNATARERIICIQRDEAEHLKILEAIYSCLSSESMLPGDPSENKLPKVDEPYPPIRVERPNPRYARILQEDFAGTVSEMTAITQYLYHHFDMEPVLREVAELLEEISIVEMTHFEMLGELIKMLGGDPVYQGSCF
jgi:rubrerythrin